MVGAETVFRAIILISFRALVILITLLLTQLVYKLSKTVSAMGGFYENVQGKYYGCPNREIIPIYFVLMPPKTSCPQVAPKTFSVPTIIF